MLFGNLSPSDRGYDAKSPRNIPLDLKRHYSTYIKDTAKYKLLPWKRVKIEETEHVKNMLLQHFAATAEDDAQFLREKEQIERTWPEVQGYMHDCPGLIRFMREVGAHSRYFYPFLLNIPRATAMLAAFFYGLDIFGNVVPIPPDDAMYQFCMNDRVFKSVRFRNEYEQEYLKDAWSPLSLAGGLLPQLWYSESPELASEMSMTVYDPDTGLERALEQIFGGQPAWLKYHYKSFDAAFKNARQWGQHDLVSAMGLASYFMKNLDYLLDGMFKMAVPGKPVVFDLQLLVTELLFDKFVLHWETESPMKPMPNAKKAQDHVAVMCKALGAKLLDAQVAPGGAGIVFTASRE